MLFLNFTTMFTWRKGQVWKAGHCSSVVAPVIILQRDKKFRMSAQQWGHLAMVFFEKKSKAKNMVDYDPDLPIIAESFCSISKYDGPRIKS